MPAIWLPVCALNHVGVDGTASLAPVLPLQGLSHLFSVCLVRGGGIRRQPPTMSPARVCLRRAFEVLFWRRDLDPDPRVKRCSPATTRQAERSITFSSSNGGSQYPRSSPHSHHLSSRDSSPVDANCHPPLSHIRLGGARDSIRKCGAKGGARAAASSRDRSRGTTGRERSPDRDASSSRAKTSHLHPFGRASGQKRWATRRGPGQVASRRWLAS